MTSLSASGQVSTANVTGTVEDTSGARIADGRIKLINLLSGTENTSQTDQDGIFILPGVLPGSYSMQVECGGFAPIRFAGLTLNIGDTKAFRIRMKVGSVAEMVNVDASGLRVDLQGASMTTVVGGRFVSNIPLNGRSFQDLITMTPGAILQSPQAGGFGNFSVNGQRTDTNTYIVDGVSANIGTGPVDGAKKVPGAGQFAGTTSLGTTQGLISVDALQEFRVLDSSYSAEYGRTPGGQFSLSTRSGTDQLHGSAYAYLRNTYFDASDWFSGFNSSTGRIYFYQQDIGGTFSAPLSIPKFQRSKDKLFLFGSYEELRVVQPTAPLVQYVPSPYLLQASSAPVQLLLSAFPVYGNGYAANSSDAAGLNSFSTERIGLPSYIRSMDYRLDRRLSQRISTFLRFGATNSGSQTIELSSLSYSKLKSSTVTAGATAQISTSMSDELRIGFARSTSVLSTVLNGYGGGREINLGAALGLPATARASRAEVYIRIPGVGESIINTDAANGSLQQWNLRDTLTKQAGRHLFSFGVDERRFTSSIDPAPLSVTADFTSVATVINNDAPDFVVTRSEPASPVFNEFSAFAQDEWKATSRLSVSLGLRWEIDPPPKGANGKGAYTLEGDLNAPSTLALAPRGTPLWHTDWESIAPRLGLALAVDNREGREFVLRAGGGLFFDTANQAAAGAFSAYGFSATSHLHNVAIPAMPPASDSDPATTGSTGNAVAYAFSPHLRLPYTLQWNMTAEKALGKRQLLTLSYVGASGQRLLQPQRRDISNENPQFPEVVSFPSGRTSTYDSFQAKFQRSVAPGLEVLASYVWSHTLDFGSTDPAFPLTHGNSDLDVRHNLQAAFSYSTTSKRERDQAECSERLGIRWAVVFPHCLSGHSTR